MMLIDETEHSHQPKPRQPGGGGRGPLPRPDQSSGQIKNAKMRTFRAASNVTKPFGVALLAAWPFLFITLASAVGMGLKTHQPSAPVTIALTFSSRDRTVFGDVDTSRQQNTPQDTATEVSHSVDMATSGSLQTSPEQTEPERPKPPESPQPPAFEAAGTVNPNGEYEGLVTVSVAGVENTNVVYVRSANSSLLSCANANLKNVTFTLTATTVISAFACTPNGTSSAPRNVSFRVGRGYEAVIQFNLDADLTSMSSGSVEQLRKRLADLMAKLLGTLVAQVTIVFRELSDREGSRRFLAAGVEATIVAVDSTQSAVIADFTRSGGFSTSMNTALKEAGLPSATGFQVLTRSPDPAPDVDDTTPAPRDGVRIPSELEKELTGQSLQLWLVAIITIGAIAAFAAAALLFYCCIRRCFRQKEPLVPLGQEIKILQAPLHQAPPPSLLQPQTHPQTVEQFAGSFFPGQRVRELSMFESTSRNAVGIPDSPSTPHVETLSPRPQLSQTDVEFSGVKGPSRGAGTLPLFPLPIDLARASADDPPGMVRGLHIRSPSPRGVVGGVTKGGWGGGPMRVHLGSAPPSPPIAPRQGLDMPGSGGALSPRRSLPPSPRVRVRVLPELGTRTPSPSPSISVSPGLRTERRLPALVASTSPPPPPLPPRGTPEPMWASPICPAPAEGTWDDDSFATAPPVTPPILLYGLPEEVPNSSPTIFSPEELEEERQRFKEETDKTRRRARAIQKEVQTVAALVRLDARRTSPGPPDRESRLLPAAPRILATRQLLSDTAPSGAGGLIRSPNRSLNNSLNSPIRVLPSLTSSNTPVQPERRFASPPVPRPLPPVQHPSPGSPPVPRPPSPRVGSETGFGSRPVDPRLLLKEPSVVPPLPPMSPRTILSAVPHLALDLASIPVDLELEAGSGPNTIGAVPPAVADNVPMPVSPYQVPATVNPYAGDESLLRQPSERPYSNARASAAPTFPAYFAS